MNKQQLASKIWETANNMRSKIDANDYKDYILGFIFYKFLSEKEIKYLKEIGWAEEYFQEYVNEENVELVENVQENIGYFISYEHLFSTWIKKGHDFNIGDVSTALSAFDRLIYESHKKVFEGIFDTLSSGLTKLGGTANEQTKAANELIYLINDIPMDGKQDYDVLGFIYEYLIGMFAANGGKKAGEFYTPHEVSVLMSEIVAEHLKDKKEIKIYDPTSGSGSLLINIGKSVSKYIENKNNIKYYAQEKKINPYNLTRMNLVMRGILPDNIVTRNGDTLEYDWPYFDENNRVDTYNPLYVDAVVSNPPYSQDWEPEGKETDPRYSRFGLAPKKKADYAFLLHDLYHIKSDGIMTIVLPHGVLSRGGEEEIIRKNLIEENHIDTIIGLPANIFFGTGIPTIIMVLKQKRPTTDVLIIDASKGFKKVGKNNKLRACDIKKIVDTLIERKDIEKYSRVVSREEIRDNEYNLNIPRYVDSSEDAEPWDIYAIMFGGIPNSEINQLNKYWEAFPTLKEDLFNNISSDYSELKEFGNVKQSIEENKDIKDFKNEFRNRFNGFDKYLETELIDNAKNVNIAKTESNLAKTLFNKLEGLSLVDKYNAYQLLDDAWTETAIDLEIIQEEGFDSVKAVDPHMVIKKVEQKNGEEKVQEIQNGWEGRILPFELVQEKMLKDETAKAKKYSSRLSEITAELGTILESLDEEYKEEILNEDKDAFSAKSITSELKKLLKDISTEETKILEKYLEISNEKEKTDFILRNTEVNWNAMVPNKKGTYTKTEVNKYIKKIKDEYKFDEESYGYIVSSVNDLLNEEKIVKKEEKESSEELLSKTIKTIENLTDEQAIELLKDKWIYPIIENLMKIPSNIVEDLSKKVEHLAKKYETTFEEVETEIKETEKALCEMMDELNGNEFDMLGIAELKKLIGGN